MTKLIFHKKRLAENPENYFVGETDGFVSVEEQKKHDNPIFNVELNFPVSIPEDRIEEVRKSINKSVPYEMWDGKICWKATISDIKGKLINVELSQLKQLPEVKPQITTDGSIVLKKSI